MSQVRIGIQCIGDDLVGKTSVGQRLCGAKWPLSTPLPIANSNSPLYSKHAIYKYNFNHCNNNNNNNNNNPNQTHFSIYDPFNETELKRYSANNHNNYYHLWYRGSYMNDERNFIRNKIDIIHHIDNTHVYLLIIDALKLMPYYSREDN